MTPRVGDVWSPDEAELRAGRSHPVLAPVYVEISPTRSAGVETFTLEIANRAWTEENLTVGANPQPRLVASRMIALDPPDLATLKLFLVEQVMQRAPYSSWTEFVGKMSDLMRWDDLSVPNRATRH